MPIEFPPRLVAVAADGGLEARVRRGAGRWRGRAECGRLALGDRRLRGDEGELEVGALMGARRLAEGLGRRGGLRRGGRVGLDEVHRNWGKRRRAGRNRIEDKQNGAALTQDKSGFVCLLYRFLTRNLHSVPVSIMRARPRVEQRARSLPADARREVRNEALYCPCAQLGTSLRPQQSKWDLWRERRDQRRRQAQRGKGD